MAVSTSEEGHITSVTSIYPRNTEWYADGHKRAAFNSEVRFRFRKYSGRIKRHVMLKVIGSGLGRTGTKSLQVGLNLLGFGPCHHLQEDIGRPEAMKLWVEAARSEPKWELIFANYRSAVDFPAAAYWQQLAEFYPDAKVVHTMRDPDDWFESTQATIFSKESPAARAKSSGERSLPLDYFESFTRSFAAHMHDRAFMTDYFRRQTESVKAVIPRERLLVYAVDEGWAPLCGFLNAPIPTTPFPVFNTRADFIARVMKPTAA